MWNVRPAVDMPQGWFSGKNFMTPDIIGYYKLKKGYAELSTGTGMRHQPIFGVTIKYDAEDKQGIGRAMSKLCQSQAEAMQYIESLS